MEQIFETVKKWLGELTQLLAGLVVLGIFIGILYEDYLGVIAGVGRIVSAIGDKGLVGLITLVIIVMWWQKK